MSIALKRTLKLGKL